eukprot:NP_001273926.1 uncharacterized protein LOC101928436 isoform 2 [Homo sapiens]
MRCVKSMAMDANSLCVSGFKQLYTLMLSYTQQQFVTSLGNSSYSFELQPNFLSITALGLTLPEEKGKTQPECPLKVKKCPHFYVQIVDLWNLHSTFDTACDS